MVLLHLNSHKKKQNTNKNKNKNKLTFSLFGYSSKPVPQAFLELLGANRTRAERSLLPLYGLTREHHGAAYQMQIVTCVGAWELQ